MKKLIRLTLFSTCFAIAFLLSNTKTSAQNNTEYDSIQPILYDMGRMWTFDFPPVDFLKKTYNITADKKWLDKARLSALRFSSYCSASFVSKDGLVMTNHHCARESGTNVQKQNENFNENGFYAAKLSDERKVPGLYVDQLLKIEDITERVLAVMKNEKSESDKLMARSREFKAIINDYKTKADWKGLELETVIFYNGGKYALYGFKRYNDVRLVFMPELHLGFYGGDYDNFTYPRYDLDCSFFRVYGEDGKPLQTENYYKFNPNGPQDDEPVFIIGNPGSTRRLSTVADLEYRRDYFLPMVLNFLKNRSSVLQKYNETAKSDAIINEIFGYENSIKALGGEYDGLKDPIMMKRKAIFEKKFKTDLYNLKKDSNQLISWTSIQNDNNELRNYYADGFMLSLNPLLTGNSVNAAYLIINYLAIAKQDPKQADEFKKEFVAGLPTYHIDVEKGYLTSYIQELINIYGKNDELVKKFLAGKTPAEAAEFYLKNSKLANEKERTKILNGTLAEIEQYNDALIEIAKIAVPRNKIANEKSRSINGRLRFNRSEIGRLLFEVYGTNIPPDATFSLRINDGVVKGYNYNGTIAPTKTTFFGLYDRYYSFNKKYPWYLPKRWQNPPMELLPIPMNFVTTNDIIGGNSGSPMVNKNLEVIGLVFDGNMESLPGAFIYIPTANRSVGVTSNGIIGALKYIYKDKRLIKELIGE